MLLYEPSRKDPRPVATGLERSVLMEIKLTFAALSMELPLA